MPQGGLTPLLLASTSPQRRAILDQLGLPYETIAPSYVEHDPPGLTPLEAVRLHAREKARSVVSAASGKLVLGVDTTVALEGTMLGKPTDRDDAAHMLGRLAGRAHAVVSGLCLLGDGFEHLADESTTVVFRPLTGGERQAYLATGEWAGRAGGYAIQGKGAALVERIEGDYTNVVGLPVAALVRALARHRPGVYGYGGNE